MAVGLNAAGVVGIAQEAAIGTYLAPTKFIPIRSETLEANNELIERRVIRNLAGLVGVRGGNLHYAGDVEIEVMDDILPYFLMAGRTNVVKGGVSPNFTYTFTPAHSALPQKSLSITVMRNGETFGYRGCIVGSINFSMDGGLLIATMSILAPQEGVEADPVPVWPTSEPFSPGEYEIEIPNATPVSDVDMSFELSIDDGGTPEFRLAGTREAEFVRFGERSVSLTLTRDFESRADFDLFKTVTSQSVHFRAERTLPTPNVNRFVDFLLPTTVKNSYSIGLAAQGDLTRAEIEYTIVSGATPEYTIAIGTAEDITV